MRISKFCKLNSALKIAGLILVAFHVEAKDYNVGPGQEYTDLSTVPWLGLSAGDNVNIHYRSEPYRSKLGIRSRGTEDSPITIRGIAGPGGEKPEIAGDGAVTPDNVKGFFSERWDESLATILIKRSSDDAWGYKPGHLIFDGLKISGGHPDYSYTGQTGDVKNYSGGSAAIWAVTVENLTVRNCDIIDNANGLFVLSKNNTEEETSRHILVENNLFRSNGISGSFREHNLYLQASDVVYQFNRIERLRPGAEGSSLKDRSAGVTIRYNWIEPSARAIDMVDPQDSYEILTKEPGFADTYVYGNYIYHDTTGLRDNGYTVGSNLVHFGGDTEVYSIYRSNLYFYHNTVAINSSSSDAWKMRLFDLSSASQTVYAENNILHMQGTSNFYPLSAEGTVNFVGNNWIKDGWVNSTNGTINVQGKLVEGDSPGFVSFDGQDLSLAENSGAIDQGTELSSGLPAVEYETDDNMSSSSKVKAGSNWDLGAKEFESDTSSALALPNPPVGLSVRVLEN